MTLWPSRWQHPQAQAAWGCQLWRPWGPATGALAFPGMGPAPPPAPPYSPGSYWATRALSSVGRACLTATASDSRCANTSCPCLRSVNTSFPWLTSVNTSCPWLISVNTSCPWPTSVNTSCPWPTTVKTSFPWLTSVNAGCQWLTSVNSNCQWLISINTSCPWLTSEALSKTIQRWMRELVVDHHLTWVRFQTAWEERVIRTVTADEFATTFRR